MTRTRLLRLDVGPDARKGGRLRVGFSAVGVWAVTDYQGFVLATLHAPPGVPESEIRVREDTLGAIEIVRVTP